MLEKFISHRQGYFTIQDLMDDIGHEIEKYRNIENSDNVVETARKILLLRMLKSDLRNIVRRYEKLELLLK